MTYTMFEVSDGNSFNQRFGKCYHQSQRLINFPMIYNNPLSFKIFHWHSMFEGIVSGFLGIFNGMVSVDVFENIIVEFYVLRPFKRYKICYHY